MTWGEHVDEHETDMKPAALTDCYSRSMRLITKGLQDTCDLCVGSAADCLVCFYGTDDRALKKAMGDDKVIRLLFAVYARVSDDTVAESCISALGCCIKAAKKPEDYLPDLLILINADSGGVMTRKDAFSFQCLSLIVRGELAPEIERFATKVLDSLDDILRTCPDRSDRTVISEVCLSALGRTVVNSGFTNETLLKRAIAMFHEQAIVEPIIRVLQRNEIDAEDEDDTLVELGNGQFVRSYVQAVTSCSRSGMII
jgi:hypothetical protein